MSTGVQIPGYELRELIKQGSTITSWKAYESLLERNVVLHIFNCDGSEEDRNAIAAVIAQIEKAATVRSGALVKILDIGEHEGTKYVVTEAITGVPFSEEVERRSVISETEVLRVIEQLAEILDRAWDEKRLFHANIKPENIMLGQNGSPKLFGLGFAMKGVIDDPITGQPVEIYLGTPNYMSPEQITGDKSIDTRTDIYSLGATIYHLVTGYMPFGNTPGKLSMDRHLKGQITNPRDINSAISQGFAFLITKMMMKYPSDRYSSWSEVLDDVKRISTNRFSVQEGRLIGTSTVKEANRLLEKTDGQVISGTPAQNETSSTAQQVPTPLKKKGNSAVRVTAPVSVRLPQGERKSGSFKRKRLHGIWITLMKWRWVAVVALWIHLVRRLLTMP